MKVAGRFVPFPEDPPIDPVKTGARVIVERADHSRLLDAQVPSGVYDTQLRKGWKAHEFPTGATWQYKASDPNNPITKLKLVVQHGEGITKFDAEGRGGAYHVTEKDLPLKILLVLDSATAQCGELTFPTAMPDGTGCYSDEFVACRQQAIFGDLSAFGEMGDDEMLESVSRLAGMNDVMPHPDGPVATAPVAHSRDGVPGGNCAAPVSCWEELSLVDLCRVAYEIPSPQVLSSDDECVTSSQADRIRVRAGQPIGGMTRIRYDALDDFERIDFRVTFDEFDERQNFYLQLYEGSIGGEGFYFGIQNRETQRDRMLIFSRWFSDREVVELTGLGAIPACGDLPRRPYRNRVAIYQRYAREHPEAMERFRAYASNAVRTNAAIGGVAEISTSEGPYVGVRVPGFHVAARDTLRFSIVREEEEVGGVWYRYAVVDEQSGHETWVGSLRFPPGALIAGGGSSWTELFGPLVPLSGRRDNCQHFSDLPRSEFRIEPLLLYGKRVRVRVSYGENDVRMPRQDVAVDVAAGRVAVRLGPDVARDHGPQTYYLERDTHGR